MQKMYNLDKWTTLTGQHAILFARDQPRMVTLQVNAPQETRLFVACEVTDQVYFLALVKGRDTVTFGVAGRFKLLCDDDSEVNIFTDDSALVHLEPVDRTSLTTIVERRKRNPEFEAMMHIMQMNVERRLAEQSQEFERRIAARASVGALLKPDQFDPEGNRRKPGSDNGSEQSAGRPPEADGGGTPATSEGSPLPAGPGGG